MHEQYLLGLLTATAPSVRELTANTAVATAAVLVAMRLVLDADEPLPIGDYVLNEPAVVERLYDA